MSYSVSSLPIPSFLRKKLGERSIFYVTDFVDFLPWQDGFSKEQITNCVARLKLSDRESIILISALETYFTEPAKGQGGLKIPPVITFCHALDKLLSGGLRAGKVLELLAEPGSACTQLCMQIALASTIPRAFGGRECDVLYIDCDGGCSPDRLKQLSEAALAHLHKVASTNTQKTALCGLSCGELLTRVQIARCTEYTQLLALLHQLRQDCSYGVVIVDSLATHFRHEFDDMRKRTHLLAGVTNTILSLCVKYSVSLVTVNHVRTGGAGRLQPCLGESWSHTADVRLFLRRQPHAPDNTYSATLMKDSEGGVEGSATFRVSSLGIRDCY